MVAAAFKLHAMATPARLLSCTFTRAHTLRPACPRQIARQSRLQAVSTHKNARTTPTSQFSRMMTLIRSVTEPLHPADTGQSVRRHTTNAQNSANAPLNGQVQNSVPPSLSLSSMRRVVPVLRIDGSGRLKEQRLRITQLKDESRLHMRELLVVEQPSALMQPRILPRRHCIVMTIGFIRAIVWPDRVYLFSPSNPQVQSYARALSAHIAQVYGNEHSASSTPASTSAVDSSSIPAVGTYDPATAGPTSEVDAVSAEARQAAHAPAVADDVLEDTASSGADVEMVQTQAGLSDDALQSDAAAQAAESVAVQESPSGAPEGKPVTYSSLSDDETTASASHRSACAVPPMRGGNHGRNEDSMAFELVVMEHALLTVQARQARRVAYARHVLDSILSKMGTVERDDGRLYALFPLANTLTHYEMVCRGLMECVRALLDDDRDMREACLSDKVRLSRAIADQAAAVSRAELGAYSPNSTDRYQSGVWGDAILRPLHVPGVPAEGSDAFLGHPISPISAHRHIRRVLRTSEPGDDDSEADDFDSAYRGGRSDRQASQGTLPMAPVVPVTRPSGDEDSSATAAAATAAAAAARGVMVSFGTLRRGRASRGAILVDDETSGTPAVLRISRDALSNLELMLESVYHLSAETTMNVVELSRTLKNKQDLLELQQSNYRNYILSVSLRMSVLGVAVSTATFMTSTFGMNLHSGLEAMPGLLYIIAGSSALLGVYLYRYIDKLIIRSSPTQQYARRLQAFQELMWKLDTKMDAARSTLSTVSSAGGIREAPTTGRIVSNEYAGDHDVLPPDTPLVDATGKGLSKSEFKRVYETKTGRSMSDEEVEIMFELLDTDTDGRLRLQEVMDVGVVPASRFESPEARGGKLNSGATGMTGI